MYEVNVLCVKFSDILAHFYAYDTFMEIRCAVTWLATKSGWARSKRSAICSGKLRKHHYFGHCCPCGYGIVSVNLNLCKEYLNQSAWKTLAKELNIFIRGMPLCVIVCQACICGRSFLWDRGPGGSMDMSPLKSVIRCNFLHSTHIWAIFAMLWIIYACPLAGSFAIFNSCQLQG